MDIHKRFIDIMEQTWTYDEFHYMEQKQREEIEWEQTYGDKWGGWPEDG